MSSTSQKLPAKPAYDVPVQLPNGSVNPVWEAWFAAVDKVIRRLQEEV